jgi:DNA-binding NtrC family response regulator
VLQGETGCGKELVARALHEASPRAAEPLVVFDCGSADPALIGSALFGVDRVGRLTFALRGWDEAGRHPRWSGEHLA